MRSMRDMTRLWASCAFALACLALGLRILAPPGFMVAAPDEGRSSPIVICTGHGPQTLHLDDQGRPLPADDDRSSGHGPCVFAAVGPALAGQPPLLAAEVVYWRAAAPGALAADVRPGAGLSAPPPPQTGPPRFA
ncbi:hypothetical protein [Phenylobacterium sp.]|uniref:hypothetical protein n=1 Tax=Phenylobacterium sp. TaxID=1871053 RepID=UPI0035B3A71C